MQNIFLFFIIVFFLTVTLSSAYFHKIVPGTESIIIVSSYSSNDLCGRPQYQGVIQALKENLHDRVAIYSFFLNSKQLNEQGLERRVNNCISFIKKHKPKILVTIDDTAFHRVGLQFCGSKDVYVIFSGVNRNISFYNKRYQFLHDRTPVKNVTGVHESLFINQQLEFLRLLINRDCRLVVLYSTDFMGKIVKNQVAQEISTNKNKTLIDYMEVSSLQDIDHAAQIINNDPDVCAYIPLVLSIQEDDSDHYLTTQDLAPILTGKIKKIDITINKAFTKVGFFGGLSVDFYHMGYQAGQMAIMLLDGFDISKLPVQDSARYEIILNKKRIQELGIRLDNEIYCLIDELI